MRFKPILIQSILGIYVSRHIQGKCRYKKHE